MKWWAWLILAIVILCDIGYMVLAYRYERMKEVAIKKKKREQPKLYVDGGE